MKAKKLKVHCPAMTVRKIKSPKTTLKVYYYEHTVGLPWKQLRPMIACAFRHVQREALLTHGENFLRRSRMWQPELYLANGKHGYWWGRAVGQTARVFIGTRHTDARKTVYPKYKDMPVFWHRDWQEHLVGIVAHELWHRWQPGHGKKAEIMCELVESDAIDTYRKEQGYTFTPPAESEPIETVNKTEPEPILV